MKRILIFSDTHDYISPCSPIIENTAELAAVIHAGDNVRDAHELRRMYPSIPFYYVRGNNDFYSEAPETLTINVDGVRIVVVHGHKQRVKYDIELQTLTEFGEKLNADLVVFGHTHKPRTEYRGKMIILNPGSVCFSRTYAVAEIDNGVLKTCIKETTEFPS